MKPIVCTLSGMAPLCDPWPYTPDHIDVNFESLPDIKYLQSYLKATASNVTNNFKGLSMEFDSLLVRIYFNLFDKSSIQFIQQMA